MQIPAKINSRSMGLDCKAGNMYLAGAMPAHNTWWYHSVPGRGAGVEISPRTISSRKLMMASGDGGDRASFLLCLRLLLLRLRLSLFVGVASEGDDDGEAVAEQFP